MDTWVDPWKEALKDRFSHDWSPIVDCEDGWRDLILELVANLDHLGMLWGVLQIKQKAGGLRFYATPFECTLEERYHFYELIRVAQERSRLLCERCGLEGDNHRIQSGGYCKKCAEK